MVKLKIPPYRLLLVTFDLIGTVPSEQRYRQADAALSIHGSLYKPVKQIRLLITRSTSKRIKASIDQQIGKQTNVLIVPLNSIPAWRIRGVAQRREWRAFVRDIEDHGIQVKYLTEDSESIL